MKKNNLYGIGITLNLFQLILCLGVMGIRKLGILGDMYVRISVFALEAIMWILIGMYLFIKYDLTGIKSSLKASVTAVLPVVLLTAVAAAVGYFGDMSGSDWLGFAFLGSSVSFYNKPAVILTEIIPIADGYVMFAVNYAVLFISSLIGTVSGAAINNKIRNTKKENPENPEPEKDDLSMTQLLEKIDENAMEGISDEADEALSDVVLDEQVEAEDEDSTMAVISIDDDDDDSEILGQETVEIISIDVEELEDEAENLLKNRYNDISPDEADECAAEELTEDTPYASDIPVQEENICPEEMPQEAEETEEETPEEITEAVPEETEMISGEDEEVLPEDEMILYNDDFTEPAEETDESITEEIIYPQETEEEYEEALPERYVVVDTLYEEDIVEGEGAFEDLFAISGEDISEENGWTFLSEEESDALLRLAMQAPAGDFEEDDDDDYEESSVISFDEMIEIIMQEDTDEDEILATEEDSSEENDAASETDEAAENEDGGEEISGDDEVADESGEYHAITVLDEEIDDFSDISIEDIENYSDAENDDYDENSLYEAENETVYSDEQEFSDDISGTEAEMTAEETSDEEAEEDDISEEQLRGYIRNGSEEEIKENPATEVQEADEMSVIADYVRSVSVKEKETEKVAEKENAKAKSPAKTQKDIRAQRDREFDNWLNRKTARIDVKAIREALKETEEE